MPVFNNITDVLRHTGGDSRFLPVALPYGFNHWSEGRRQLLEDNPTFFAKHELGATQDIGVLATEDGSARGWMAIFPGSRYVCTNWAKRLTTPTVIPKPYLLGAQVRKAIAEGLKT
jgi:hypothetical protein